MPLIPLAVNSLIHVSSNLQSIAHWDNGLDAWKYWQRRKIRNPTTKRTGLHTLHGSLCHISSMFYPGNFCWYWNIIYLLNSLQSIKVFVGRFKMPINCLSFEDECTRKYFLKVSWKLFKQYMTCWKKISCTEVSGLLLAFLGLLRNYLVLKWLISLFLNR